MKKHNLNETINECVDKCLKKYLNEYLDKMTSSAMRSLGTIEEPSNLSKTTYRYLNRDLNNPQKNTVGLHKNNWLIHITGHDEAMSIMKKGFMSHAKNLQFTATQILKYDLEDDGLCFACELNDTNSWLQITNEFEDNEWCGVIFQANGFNAQSFLGSKNIREVIFSTKSAHNFLLLLPMTENEKQNYIKHNEKYHNDDYSNYYGYCKVIDKKGKCVFKGQIDTLFERVKQPNQTRLTTPSYAEDYLNYNLAQNINRMWNPKK